MRSSWTALPYQVSAGTVARKIADLVNARELEGIADVNDESSGDDTRFVIKLKRDANPEVVLNNLWKHTPLQSSFAMNVVALVDGVPRTLSLRDALVAYVTHQIEVVTRRSEFRLTAARSRLHIAEGLLRALDAIDEIIATIRASENTAAARASLMAEPYEFSEEQANHILEMALSRLTRLGRTQLETEATEKRTLIADLEALLADEHRLRMAIRDELKEIAEKFGTGRRSVLEIDPGELDIEDLIDDDDLVFTMSASGYVKTVPYRRVPPAGPWRPRGGRREAQAGRQRHAPDPHHGPLLPVVLQQPGPGLPAEGPRGAGGLAHRAGHFDREPPVAAGRRADTGSDRHP